MELVAIVYEDDKPVRLFKGDGCIYKAYRWAHRTFCLELSDPPLRQYELPDYLKVTFHMMTEDQIKELVK